MGLLEMSVYGGVMILAVAALRAALLKRLPKRIFPLLWMAVLLRLLAPFDIPAPFSMYSLLGRGLQQLASVLPESAKVYEGYDGNGIYHAAAAKRGGNETEDPKGYGAEGILDSQGKRFAGLRGIGTGDVLRTVWGIGALCCGIFFGGSYVWCLKRFGAGVSVEDETVRRLLDGQGVGRRVLVRQCGEISAPLTYGFFRPVILLPESIVLEDARKLEYVLGHECVHVRRCDAMVKLAMVAALCIHWFNPLVWIMSGLLARDIELACDEGVLQRFGEDARSGYALTLIAMEERKKGFLPLYNGFSKHVAEERIRAIMRYSKGMDRRIGAALPLGLAVLVFFATSAATDAMGGTEGPGDSPWGQAVGQSLADMPGISGIDGIASLGETGREGHKNFEVLVTPQADGGSQDDDAKTVLIIVEEDQAVLDE